MLFQNTFQHSEIQDPRSDLLPCWFNFAHKIGSSGSWIPVTSRFASCKTAHKLLLLQKNWSVIQTHNLPNLGSEFCIWGTKWRIWAAFRNNAKSGAELMLEWDSHIRVQIHVHVSFSVGPSYNSSWPSSYHQTDDQSPLLLVANLSKRSNLSSICAHLLSIRYQLIRAWGADLDILPLLPKDWAADYTTIVQQSNRLYNDRTPRIFLSSAQGGSSEACHQQISWQRGFPITRWYESANNNISIPNKLIMAPTVCGNYTYQEQNTQNWWYSNITEVATFNQWWNKL